MTLVPLPPKRFESTEDAKYDPIRWRGWFCELAKRRTKLPLLKQAHYDLLAYTQTQKEAAERYGVDERELRDYTAFVSLRPRSETATFQHILDTAYKDYVEHSAIRGIRQCIYDAAILYGIKPRHVQEAWETDPFFYPTNYPFQKGLK